MMTDPAHQRDERDAEAFLDALDPATTPAEDPVDLRRIGLALREVDTAEAELREAVAAARSAGYTWAQIGMVLGVSRQAAHERFAEHTPQSSSRPG